MSAKPVITETPQGCRPLKLLGSDGAVRGDPLGRALREAVGTPHLLMLEAILAEEGVEAGAYAARALRERIERDHGKLSQKQAETLILRLLRTDPAARRALANGTCLTAEVYLEGKGQAGKIEIGTGGFWREIVAVDLKDKSIRDAGGNSQKPGERISGVTALAVIALAHDGKGSDTYSYAITVAEPAASSTLAAAALAEYRTNAIAGIASVAAELTRLGEYDLADAVIAQTQETWT